MRFKYFHSYGSLLFILFNSVLHKAIFNFNKVQFTAFSFMNCTLGIKYLKAFTKSKVIQIFYNFFYKLSL